MLGKQHRQLCHISRRAVVPAVVRAQARRPARQLVHPHAAAHAGCDSSLEECFAEPSSYTHSTLLHLFESVRAHESSLSAGIVVHDLAQGELAWASGMAQGSGGPSTSMRFEGGGLPSSA